MKAAVYFLLFFLVACGRSTPTNYYLLESNAGILKIDHMPEKTIRIAQVEIPGYLNRNNIVSRVKGQSKLILAEFHLWAEPVGNGTRRVIEEILTPALLGHKIAVLPGNSESRSDYTLLLDLQRLDGNFNEMAVLECRWTLADKNDKPLERGLFSEEEMVEGANYNFLVEAESRLLRKFGNYLGDKLPGAIKNYKNVNERN